MQAVATGSSSCPFLKNVAQQSNSRGVAISMARNILTHHRDGRSGSLAVSLDDYQHPWGELSVVIPS
jgi:hypothetical protein